MAKISFLEMDGYKVIQTNQSIMTLKQLVMDGINMDSDLGQFRYQSHIPPPSYLKYAQIFHRESFEERSDPLR